MNMLWSFNAPTIEELEKEGFTCKLSDNNQLDILAHDGHEIGCIFDRETSTLDEIREWDKNNKYVFSILYEKFPQFGVYDEFDYIDNSRELEEKFEDQELDDKLLELILQLTEKWKGIILNS